MHFSLYLRHGTVFVPTTGRVVPGGPYRDMEPVGVRSGFESGGGAPSYPRSDLAGQSASTALPTRQFSSTGRNQIRRRQIMGGICTRHLDVGHQRERWNRIIGYRRHPDGWREDPEQTVDLPAGSTMDDAIDRLIAIMQDAAGK